MTYFPLRQTTCFFIPLVAPCKPLLLYRDTRARDTYRKEIKKSKSYRNDIFVLDILREEMSNDDPRIQRSLFE